MTKEQFHRMSLPEKARWLCFNGQHVTSIRYYAYKVNLYLLGQVYVEVFYHAHKDVVERIDLLDETSKRINFYADQVKLPEGLM